MSKFKIGDRVRFLPTVPKHWWFKAGEEGRIFNISAGGHSIDVKTGPKNDIAFVQPEHIELVNPSTTKESATKTWIISLLAGGKLNPALNPKTYTSEAQAHRVAKEMAEKHRGSTFVVFEATGFVHLPVAPSTEVIKL